MTPREKYSWFSFVACLVVQGAVIVVPGKIPSVPFVQPVTSVTYVHEKNDSAIPNGVRTAINKLNQQGIVATAIDQDVKDGNGEVPEQYKTSLPAAKSAGLPALVVMAGKNVKAVVKNPQSELECLEAAK